MLPKKKLAKAEQEGDETIIRGPNAKQTFRAVNNMHIESANPISASKIKHSSADESEDEESSVSNKNNSASALEPPSKRARIE